VCVCVVFAHNIALDRDVGEGLCVCACVWDVVLQLFNCCCENLMFYNVVVRKDTKKQQCKTKDTKTIQCNKLQCKTKDTKYNATQ
jgi:hypothetical protein